MRSYHMVTFPMTLTDP